MTDKNWYEKNPPHLVAVGQGAREYIEAECARLEGDDQQVLSLTPETAISLGSRFFSSTMRAETLFVWACEAVIKTTPALCELIAKHGRAMNVHLLAAYLEPDDVPSALQADVQIVRGPA